MLNVKFDSYHANDQITYSQLCICPTLSSTLTFILIQMSFEPLKLARHMYMNLKENSSIRICTWCLSRHGSSFGKKRITKGNEKKEDFNP